jgi:hypothetical protein
MLRVQSYAPLQEIAAEVNGGFQSTLLMSFFTNFETSCAVGTPLSMKKGEAEWRHPRRRQPPIYGEITCF